VGRYGNGRDIANAVWFLCSENASFITGQAITVDGGLTLALQVVPNTTPRDL
jgi:3-oxoacyl-[acyl-carrier protein] reductase